MLTAVAVVFVSSSHQGVVTFRYSAAAFIYHNNIALDYLDINNPSAS